jgi:hypothetical protein
MDFKIGIEENKETVIIKLDIGNGNPLITTIPYNNNESKLGMTIYNILTELLQRVIRRQVKEKLLEFGFDIHAGRPIADKYKTDKPKYQREKNRERARLRYYERKEEKEKARTDCDFELKLVPK